MQMADNQIEKYSIDKVERLKELIKDHGGTSKSFAEKIKMSTSYLSEVLNHKKEPPKYLSSKLKKFANVNEDWFDTGYGNKYDSETKTNSNMNEDEKIRLLEENSRLAKELAEERKKRLEIMEKLLDKSIS